MISPDAPPLPGKTSAKPQNPGFDASLLACPACKGGEERATEGGMRCNACGHVAPWVGGVLDFRLDRNQDSALDAATYDAHHKVDPATSKAVFHVYDEAIRRHQRAPRGRILEIGAGTGNLTHGLCTWGNYDEVHCSDISPRFLALLHAKLSAEVAGASLRSYLFDANYLPFQAATFDTVVGHSILHHLKDFEVALAGAHRVLKPGGIAIFGEPVMDFHSLCYLAADLIMRVDTMVAVAVLSAKSRRVLSVIAARGAQKMKNLLERDASVVRFEDKFIFPTAYMRGLSRQIGFSQYDLVQMEVPIPKLGETIAQRLKAEMNSVNANSAELDAFAPVLAAFSETLDPSMSPFLPRPFSYHVFVK